MKICICKSVIGTEKHLVHEGTGSFSWVDVIPEDAWSLGDKSRVLDLSDLALSIGEEIKMLPRDKFVRQFKDLLGSDVSKWSKHISWQDALPKADYKKFVNKVIQEALGVLDNPDAISYSEVLKNDRKTLLSISRAKINQRIWSLNKRTAVSGQKDAVSSFRPDDEGFAELPIYERSKTTGRVTIPTGPKILHLKKEYRKFIDSRFEGGRVVQLDYISMEPRILMDLVGRKPTQDVYEYTSKNVLDGALNRDKSKAVVMGVLYGIGASKLQTMIGNTVNAEQVLAEVRSHFGVSILEKRLKKELSAKGYITNHYGRILKPPRSDGPGLVSWHVQSSGVDLGLQGFGKMIEKIDEMNLKAVPIFIIHDAILLDVHPDVTEYDLTILAEAASHPPGFNQQFPLDITNA